MYIYLYINIYHLFYNQEKEILFPLFLKEGMLRPLFSKKAEGNAIYFLETQVRSSAMLSFQNNERGTRSPHF